MYDRTGLGILSGFVVADHRSEADDLVRIGFASDLVASVSAGRRPENRVNASRSCAERWTGVDLPVNSSADSSISHQTFTSIRWNSST